MDAEGYFLNSGGEPLEKRSLDLGSLDDGEVLVEVGACGVCHTDLSFASGGVTPRHELPLVLGHEIMGTVVHAADGMEDLLDRPVLVPAVLPCGECAYCRAGRTNICPRQKMPGNDIHGGFATHVAVPGRFLVPLDDAPDALRLEELAVVADAVSTAYQAVRRSGLSENDLAVVVGAGGVGGFALQIAKALGARTLACDVDPERLDEVLGADETVDLSELEAREARQRLRGLMSESGIPPLRHRIFECSGSGPGQTLAFGLLGPAATLLQVGYTREKIEVRWSNLMAFDATVYGSWGCPPDLYPEVLELIYAGEVEVSPFVEHTSLDELNTVLDDMANHRLRRRMILHPEAA